MGCTLGIRRLCLVQVLTEQVTAMMQPIGTTIMVTAMLRLLLQVCHIDK
jgi:hypothetical protein